MFRLETSPSHNLISNRAELRAAVAAPVETDWKTEGFRGIVIATDSEYVARGATDYMPSWRNELTGEWKVKKENMDLCHRLMTAIEVWQSQEFPDMFYAIRRGLNRADRYAKEATVSVTSSRILLVKDLDDIESSGLRNLSTISLIDRNKSPPFRSLVETCSSAKTFCSREQDGSTRSVICTRESQVTRPLGCHLEFFGRYFICTCKRSKIQDCRLWSRQ